MEHDLSVWYCGVQPEPERVLHSYPHAGQRETESSMVDNVRMNKNLPFVVTLFFFCIGLQVVIPFIFFSLFNMPDILKAVYNSNVFFFFVSSLKLVVSTKGFRLLYFICFWMLSIDDTVDFLIWLFNQPKVFFPGCWEKTIFFLFLP